jgi:hypothetical protein
VSGHPASMIAHIDLAREGWLRAIKVGNSSGKEIRRCFPEPRTEILPLVALQEI